MAKFKLFNNKGAALASGCSEDQITEKDGVFYCECDKVIKKELKVEDLKVTKEFKTSKDAKVRE